MTVSQQNAEAIALKALGFIVADEDRLIRFVTLTGVSTDELKSNLGEADFQASLLDYLLQDESLLMMFAANCSIKPEEVMPARVVIGGRPSFEI